MHSERVSQSDSQTVGQSISESVRQSESIHQQSPVWYGSDHEKEPFVLGDGLGGEVDLRGHHKRQQQLVLG